MVYICCLSTLAKKLGFYVGASMRGTSVQMCLSLFDTSFL